MGTLGLVEHFQKIFNEKALKIITNATNSDYDLKTKSLSTDDILSFIVIRCLFWWSDYSDSRAYLQNGLNN